MKTPRLNGFTLIEVLASIAVLAILVLMLTRIFSESIDAFNRGSQTVLRNAEAQAALDIIGRDIEQAVVDGRIAMYQEGNTVQTNFDTLYLITMANHQETGCRSYQQVRYYVSETDTEGFPTWTLMRGVRDFETGYDQGVDPFDPGDHQWWEDDLTGFNDSVLIDNVIRFDQYINNENAQLINVGGSTGFFGGPGYYDSTIDIDIATAQPSGDPTLDPYPANRPPAYIDVYLQVVSDDIMRRAQLSIRSSNSEVRKKGWSLLYRESNVMMSRFAPFAGSGERAYAVPY